MPKSDKSRKYTWTFNNYTQDDIDAIKSIDARYLCFGKEVGSVEGTPHLQGFVFFANARAFDSVRALFPRGVHLEVSNGTPKQNKAYCSKDGDFYEQGECPIDAGEKGALEKERWADIIKLSREGNFEEICLKYPDVYGSRLRTLEYLRSKRPRDVSALEGPGPFHEWIVGPTGCGKSRGARADNPGAYIKEPESKWWDSYDGEAVVIIDDFDKFQVAQGGSLKRWLDRYPFQAEVKGGMQMIRPKKIIVTSQYHPHEIWDDQKTVDAIMRRVNLRVLSGLPVIPPMFVSTFVKPN